MCVCVCVCVCVYVCVCVCVDTRMCLNHELHYITIMHVVYSTEMCTHLYRKFLDFPSDHSVLVCYMFVFHWLRPHFHWFAA